MPQIALKARAWNSACAPFPIIAITRESRGASQRAAMALVAAVRSAVRMVISDSSSGYPVATSASTPKAVTVCSPWRMLPGWPFTYLNP